MTNEQLDSLPRPPFWRFWPVMVLGFFTSMFFWWVGLAGTDYHGQHPLMSFTTAGWFFLGLPMTLGMSIAFGCIAALLARKSWIWCVAAFGVAVALTGAQIYVKLPASQVASLIGDDAASVTHIERLRVHDSMNAGEFTSGILAGPKDLAERIARHREMNDVVGRLYRLRQSFPDSNLPETGRLWTDDRMLMYRDDASQLIYFCED